jgi:archaemetzincin
MTRATEQAQGARIERLPSAAGDVVFLWWIGSALRDQRQLLAVKQQIQQVFEVKVQFWKGDDRRPSDTFDPRRGQHLSTGILKWLAANCPPGAMKVVALTDVDLFIPVLTFVYGEAQLDGTVAVVSTARLGDGTGHLMDERLLVSRLEKECVHELGHTFGLLHCSLGHCVMARSVNLPHVDAKGADLCPACRNRYRSSRWWKK